MSAEAPRLFAQRFRTIPPFPPKNDEFPHFPQFMGKLPVLPMEFPCGQEYNFFTFMEAAALRAFVPGADTGRKI